jgi:hypothetical protein
MVATQHDNNTVATHGGSTSMVQTLLGTDNSIKSKKVDTTICHTIQPQVSEKVSMI